MNWILSNMTPTLAKNDFWMPVRASTYADEIDWLFWFIFWISVFFTVLIFGLLVWFVLKYRHREGQDSAEEARPHHTHSTLLEIGWSVVPLLIVIAIFYFGFRGYMNMSVAPADAYEVQVQARTWGWSFIYPDGTSSEKLYVPVNRPVRLVMTSVDVIHSFYVPQFRIKKDLVPGRYNRTWFEANKTGTFDIFCTEYCGTGHSDMLTHVIVQEESEFRETLADLANWEKRLSPLARGEQLYKAQGCAGCHSIDGSAMQCPTFKDSFNTARKFTDGTSAVMDEDYVRQSVYDPGARIVAGYGNNMPSYRGILKENDVQAIIWFLKANSANFRGDLSPGSVVGAGSPPATAPATRPSAANGAVGAN